MSDEIQFVEEAPESGKPYARKFQLWVETYDRVTLEQFIAAVRGLAEGAALEADRSFTEAERAKREADRAKTMADSTATYNQNCQTAVTTCTQLVQQAKSAEVGANSAAGTAGGHAQTAGQAATAAQADAGRAQTQAQRAQDEADRAQRIVDNFNPGSGGGGGDPGMSEVIFPELGSWQPPVSVNKTHQGKTLCGYDSAQVLWIDADTDPLTDMPVGGFCDVKLFNRVTPFVIRVARNVELITDRGTSHVLVGDAQVRLQKVGKNQWVASSQNWDTQRRRPGFVNQPDFQSWDRFATGRTGRWCTQGGDRRGAEYAGGRLTLFHTGPGGMVEYTATKRNLYPSLVGEQVQWFGTWDVNNRYARQIFGVVDPVNPTDEHNVFIGFLHQTAQRMEFPNYPATEWIILRLEVLESWQWERRGIKCWFVEKATGAVHFDIFYTTGSALLEYLESQVTALRDYVVIDQWAGQSANTPGRRVGRKRDTGETYELIVEPNRNPDLALTATLLDPQPQGDVTAITLRNDWGAFAWLDSNGTLHVRMFSGDVFKWVTKEISIPQVAEYRWVQRDGQEFEILLIDSDRSWPHLYRLEWDGTEAMDVEVNEFVSWSRPIRTILDQTWTTLGQETKSLLLLCQYDVPHENREITGLVVCGDLTGNFEFNELANYPAQIDWNTENRREDHLELWGCWKTYRQEDDQRKLWWGVQTSQGILLYDPERSDVNPDIPR